MDKGGGMDVLKIFATLGAVLLLATVVTASTGRAAASDRVVPVTAETGQTLPDDGQMAVSRAMRWFPQQSSGLITGVALVVHGLNLNPDRMNEIIAALNAGGIAALRVSLRGHGDNFTPVAGLDSEEARLEAFKSAAYASWSLELLQAFRRAERLRRKRAVPLFLVANSYGALLALDLTLTHEEVAFDRMVLFAPALAMHSRNHVIRLLNPFPNLVVPSFSPRRYLANQGTPVAAYEAVFETLAHFERSLGRKINVPSLVFIDPRDELISYEGLEALITAQRLDNWTIRQVAKSGADSRVAIHHLIVDQASMGGAAWEEMMTRMRTHLLRPLFF